MVWSWLTWFGAGIYLLTETPDGDRREGGGVLQGVTLSLLREIDNTVLYTRRRFGELLCIVLASQILFAKSQYLGTIEGGYVCVSYCLPLLLFVLLLIAGRDGCYTKHRNRIVAGSNIVVGGGGQPLVNYSDIWYGWSMSYT